MTDLLDEIVEAHGGLARWNELETVSAHLVQGGAVWGLKGRQGVLDDVRITDGPHEELVSHRPFGAPGRRSAFTPERMAIETTEGEVLEELERPRDSFAGHTLDTPWTTLQLAYFVGTAMWTCLTQPFTFTLPGFETKELEPWQEKGKQWRRLRVVWPAHRATHNSVQTVYVDDDGLIRREDHDVDIMAGSPGAHYIAGFTQVAGITLPTERRILPRTPEGQALAEPLLVSIDLSDLSDLTFA
ncbi:hypothetical protein ABT237_31370 [Streptomyces sp. NPDC001581]|uniref:hypothetical protein n=1 Tax=Streptomyces sp. NPDC001581 TaxID=3154386 RepID=UPI00331B2E5C